LIRPVIKNPQVTAGLTCAPEMPPKLLIASDSPNPCASAIATRAAPGSIPFDVARIAAIPGKQR
jgi:hypothetical protein